MCQFVYILFLITSLFLQTVVVDSKTVKKEEKNVFCSEIPPIILEEILGAAYNSRYMSIQNPTTKDDESKIRKSDKRTVNEGDHFYVKRNEKAIYEDVPAWEVKNHVTNKRDSDGELSNVDYTEEWHCTSKIIWKDLGPEYFPRYLRSVECHSKPCWFNIYTCKPRSFAVKLLRRRRGICVTLSPGVKGGDAGLPNELKELWIWEEHALNFCCECRLN